MAFLYGVAFILCCGLQGVLLVTNPVRIVKRLARFGNDNQGHVPVTRIQSVAGMLTNLPCNITPSSELDRVNIVLWYKDGLGKPLYSFDLRQQSLDDQGKIWASESNSKMARAQLFTHSEPTAVLALHGVTQEDAGTYRCRVDFKRSPTRYRKIALDVIVPPSKAIIMDERGMEVRGSKVGPVLEGSTLILTCDIIGGSPASSVSWWQDGQLIDGSFEEIIPGKSRNTMKVESLHRQHRHTEFTCSGNNNNRSQALSKSVILDLYLRPLSVEVQAVERGPFYSGHNKSFSCISYGSYPSPKISWWIDDRFNIDSHTEVAEDNRTVSTLVLSAKREMHGGKLSCKVENPLVPKSQIKDDLKLQIHYPPEVSVELGSKLNAVDIREGDDVYFECTIDAFPSAERISWKKDNETLVPNEQKGILINEYSLVLQNVGHHSIGKYMCMASNDAGQGSSQQVYLDVKYSPRCGGQTQTMGIGRNEEARLICHIDSNPQPTSIKWRFNSSTHFATLPPEKFYTDGFMSYASYTPKSEIDYGTLSCWATNEVGLQKRPCVFHVIPAGPPDPVAGCQVTNKTFTTLSLECKEGYDGGLKQHFVGILCPYNTFTEVLGDSQASNVVSIDKLKCDHEISRKRNFNGASFEFDGLPHSTPFSLAIFAQNTKGRSLAFVMRAFTLRSAERQVELQEDPNEHPAATQERLLSPGWIGLTIFAPLIFCFVSAGFYRVLRRTKSSSERSNETRAGNGAGRNLMFKSTTSTMADAISSNSHPLCNSESRANNEMTEQKMAPSTTTTTGMPIVEMATVESKESYSNHLEQQWRPPQWGAATTSRLGSKGKYVFASRRQQHQQQPIRRSSMEIGEYSIATPNTTTNTGGGRVLTSSNNSTVLPGGPYLHYTTIPRRLRPLSKENGGPEDSSSRGISCKNSRNGDSLASTATTFVQQQQQQTTTTFLPEPSLTLAQTSSSSSTPLTDFPVPHPSGSISASTTAVASSHGHCASQGSILASTTASSASTTTMAKPPKEFADESTTSSSAEDIACHSQENNVLNNLQSTSDLRLTRF